MLKPLLFVFLSFILVLPSFADKASCHDVRMADIGWTDVSATTALTALLLKILDYSPKISLLSTPVAFASLKNNDLDVFLGNWMPSMEADIRPYLNEDSIVQVHRNLSGARFSLAVPRYVFQAGVRDIADLVHHKEAFEHKIYGIEAGNDGNWLILDMIRKNAFSLADFEIVESSEQGMLTALHQAIKKKDFIVFLAWSPHPMNVSYEIEYLSGGESFFGANFGASEVYTVARQHFANDCPKLFSFFQKLDFDLAMENELMRLILNEKLSPQESALAWLKENQNRALSWLANMDGINKNKAKALMESHVAQLSKRESGAYKVPLGAIIESAVLFLNDKFSNQLHGASQHIEISIRKLLKYLLDIHWSIIIICMLIIGYFCHRSISLILITLGGFLLIINMGLWAETLETLVLVIIAASLSLVIGVPLGIISAHHPKFYRILQPVLDLMQTLPTFVYLIPSLMLFGLGIVPGLISTIIFAVAAPIRLTYLGLKSVPKDLLEAADAFGANRLQRLVKIELPFALSSIMSGFSQCIMLSLSMVVIAALVGADGLGNPVVRALNTVNIRQGFEAGAAIVIVAIVLDRTLSLRPQKKLP
jgi:glycine betaine/proline transport system substrate-binding protein